MKRPMKQTTAKAPEKEMTAGRFEALPDAEKERIWREIDRENPAEQIARSKPLTARDRARWVKARRKGGRPMLGKHGVKVISLSVERALLARADAYAKAQGLKRAELFTQAILKLLPKAG